MRTGASFGRFLRDLGFSETSIKILAVVIVLAVIAAIVGKELLHKKTIQKAAFQGVTFSGETSILHLVAKGAVEPKGDGLISRLRGFANAEEVYEYVYKKFDEAVFAKIQIYQEGSAATVEFVHNPEESDEQNFSRLVSLLGNI